MGFTGRGTRRASGPARAWIRLRCGRLSSRSSLPARGCTLNPSTPSSRTYPPYSTPASRMQPILSSALNPTPPSTTSEP
ncbi:hypothetical protein VUR80DRAFT_638 [Thermomyces stellatus]